MDLKTLSQKFFIFGKLLTYPTKELKEDIEKVLLLLKEKSDQDLFKNIIKNLNDKKREVLEGEYTSLFITGYPKTPCPPYYSAHQTGLVVSEHSEELHNIYEEYGIELSNDQFPDFIPTMMEFMTLLLTNELVKEASKFYKKYLLWVSEFSENIKRNTENEYFINIANELIGFMKDVNIFFMEKSNE